MSPQIEVPDDVFERVNALCLRFPEVTFRVDESRVDTRSTAWSFDIRRRSFCLLVASGSSPAEAVTVIVVRADRFERDAMLAAGHPYFPGEAGADRLGVVLSGDSDWIEVAELVTESYRILAPKKLARLLE